MLAARGRDPATRSTMERRKAAARRRGWRHRCGPKRRGRSNVRLFRKVLPQDARFLAEAGRESINGAISRDKPRPPGARSSRAGTQRRRPLAPDLRSLPDWRHPGDYDDLLEMDRPAFAWELLRRNPRYRGEIATLERPEENGALVITPGIARLAAGWGLGFPRGSGSQRERSQVFLAGRA